MTEPQLEFLTDEEAWAVVDRLGFQVRDVGLLQSALARPRTTVFGDDAYPDLVTQAAALFESLVRNHPLLDGNKRLAVVLTWTFLALNDIELEHTEDDAYDFVTAAAAGQLPLQHLGSWFGERRRCP